MFLQEIEMLGFKSFKREKFFFDKPITVFIGPNGCGKSNVVDCIKWVLGEQSSHSLRVKSMIDLIFHGTEQEKPMSMGEVSILLDNSKGLIPIELDDIRITRRIFLSGESEYILNKRPCRLKDISNLLFDTGLSQNGYFLMEQGKLESFLKNKEERIRIFEEASNIAGYKAKKDEACSKLQKTVLNIMRIGDIMKELIVQEKNLKYQVSMVRRYKNLKEAFDVFRFKAFESEYNKREQGLQKIKNEDDELRKKIIEQEEILKEKRKLIEGILKIIEEKNEKFSSILEEKEKIKTEITKKEERLIYISEKIEYNTKKEKELLLKRKLLEDELLALNKEKEGFVLEDYPRDDETLKIKGIKEEIEVLEKKEEREKQGLIEKLREKAQIQGRLIEGERELSNIKNRLIRFDEERKRINERLNNLSKEKELQTIGKNQFIEKIEIEKDGLTKLKKRFDEILEVEQRIIDEPFYPKVIDRLIETGSISSQDIEIFKESYFVNTIQEVLGVRSIPIVYKVNLKTRVLFFIEVPKEEKGLSREEIEVIKLEKERNKRLKKEVLKEINEKETSIARYEDSLKRTIVAIERCEKEEEELKSKVLGIKNEIVLYDERKKELNLEIETFRFSLERKEKNIKHQEKRVVKIRERLKELLENERKKEEEERKKFISIELKKERYNFINEAIKKQSLGIESISSELKDICEERKKMENERIFLGNEAYQYKTMLDGILKEEGKVKGEIENHKEKVRLQEKDILSLASSIADLREKREKNSGFVVEYESRLSFLSGKLSSIIEECGEEIKKKESRIDKDTAEKIERKLESMKGINFLAESEYNTIKERILFYKNELFDLNNARYDLEELIKELDKKAKEAFDETFLRIRDNFRNLFLRIFDGGEGDIVLSDGKIEIEAKLPGKRKKGLVLLSSGEKTLLAIIFLFSLFMVKPAPFCFLDEIDASLDEANTKRFLGLIFELSKNTQFLIITHNKRTIETANTIYGITMETPGISKALSIRLT
ncbi:TPA: hypothetical protein DCX16_04255 [bacterium]|nr:hypothetical protein [bacterium]